jgi:hypothetical protein
MAIAFFIAIGIPLFANGSMNGSTANNIPNATFPQIDASNKDDNQDGKTQICQMPPCPPGELCIQVCPESIPK